MIGYSKLLKLVKKEKQPEIIRVNGIEFFWDNTTIPYSPGYFNNHVRNLEQYLGSVYSTSEIANKRMIEIVKR